MMRMLQAMRRRAVEMKRGRRSTRGMLREEVTGIHWRIDGRRSSHYYQLNHRGCDETWGHGWFEDEATRHSAWGQDKDKDKDNETSNNCRWSLLYSQFTMLWWYKIFDLALVNKILYRSSLLDKGLQKRVIALPLFWDTRPKPPSGQDRGAKIQSDRYIF